MYNFALAELSNCHGATQLAIAAERAQLGLIDTLTAVARAR
jgi:hypothetical protein